MFDMTGKTVLVSGANAGIGTGIAEALANAGANLVIWGRRTDRNEAMASALRKHGHQVLAQKVDIADESAVDAAFSAALQRFGDIYAVIANAGIVSALMPFQSLDAAEMLRVTQVNQFGSVFTLRAGARHMVERAKDGRPGGSLVMTSSMSHLVGYAGNGIYAMTKGALDALVRTLAVELGKYKIRVNSIAPGTIASEIPLPESLVIANNRNTPIARMGQPADIAAAALYLVSEASSFHTGTTLVVDGGMAIQPGPEAAHYV